MAFQNKLFRRRSMNLRHSEILPGSDVDAIDEQLEQQPTAATRHRKVVQIAEASFAFDPPLWELRVGDYRVFYDVDEPGKTVYVRSVREKPPHAATEK